MFYLAKLSIGKRKLPWEVVQLSTELPFLPAVKACRINSEYKNSKCGFSFCFIYCLPIYL